MKILWITNILFPEAQRQLIGNGELKASGGWMLASADMLIRQNKVQLFVATVTTNVHKLKIIQGEHITYYVLPFGKGNLKYNSEYELYWRQVKEQVQPDIVHIHGTEYTHGLAYINACGGERAVISIQGLKSGIAPHYCAGLSWKEIYGNLTLHDLIKGSIYSEQKAFKNTAKYEREILCKVSHIIGRTSWDKSHVWAINPKANYYVCNETLRSEFYDEPKWCYDKCEPCSIFLSQGSYPLKGFHQVLKAMPLILQHYPNATIRIAGSDITCNKGLWGVLHFTGYGKIVKRLIKKYQLKDKVTFLGPLSAQQMKTEYLRCNVFVCPSSIENSPNSLGEAQLLGVPCVASYVGGVPDIMQGNEEFLYRFEEVEMLAEKICYMFAFEGRCKNMASMVQERHDPVKNCEQLFSIYGLIVKGYKECKHQIGL